MSLFKSVFGGGSHLSETKAERFYEVIQALLSCAKSLHCHIGMQIVPGNKGGKTTYHDYDGMNVHIYGDLVEESWGVAGYFGNMEKYLSLISDIPEEYQLASGVEKYVHIFLDKGEGDPKDYVEYLRSHIAQDFPSAEMSIGSDGRRLSLFAYFD